MGQNIGDQSMSSDYRITPSVLAAIPETLRVLLESNVGRKKSILISSNSLANRFIMNRWEIKPSQRKRNSQLFYEVRQQCRLIFKHFLARGQIEWQRDGKKYVFGVFNYDGIKGNKVLGCVPISPEKEWILTTH
ncbi:MAG: hypothetical protein RTU92_00045 [Candidatus Thorarchaeota archaeon]